MSHDEWRKTWIDALVDAGVFLETAEDAFEVCYGNQDVELNSDPMVAAEAFLPRQMQHRTAQ